MERREFLKLTLGFAAAAGAVATTASALAAPLPRNEDIASPKPGEPQGQPETEIVSDAQRESDAIEADNSELGARRRWRRRWWGRRRLRRRYWRPRYWRHRRRRFFWRPRRRRLFRRRRVIYY